MALNSVGDVYAGYGQLYKLVNNAWVKLSDFRNSDKIYNIEIDPREDNTIYTTKGSSLTGVQMQEPILHKSHFLEAPLTESKLVIMILMLLGLLRVEPSISLSIF